MNKKIVVGMSGGVDSSVALLLLKEKGWDPIGVSLKLPVWADKENFVRENICCTKESIASAKKICQKIRVPHFVFDVQKEFKREVIDYFVKELEQGRTPNPCVICNRYLKFEKLFEFGKKHNAQLVATGHYARIRFNDKSRRYELLQARDKEKDQTYYLSFLTQKQLKNIVLPLGGYKKEEVYQMAKEFGLKELLSKRESQDFCFVAQKSLSSFLEKEVSKKPGKIVDEKNNVLGNHQGIHFFTIGQRKGLKLSGGPYFVKELDRKNNLVIVTKNKNQITQKEVWLYPLNLVSGQSPKNKIRARAKIRYQHQASPATFFPPNKKGQLKIVFDRPQIAVTPGQFCVFYSRQTCLGGGVIN